MTKIGRPTRLIGYDNDINVKHRVAGEREIFKPIRARTVVYASLIVVVCSVMLYALVTRSLLDVNVLHDRNPVAVKLSDGSIRNGYTLRFLNKRGFDRVITVDLDGPPNAQIHVVGLDSVTPDRPMIVLGRDTTTEIRVLVTAPFDETAEKTVGVKFRVTDIGLGEVASATDHFVAPDR
jgi:polyferredoxin